VVIMRGLHLPHQSGKGDSSGIKVLSVSLFTWLDIKTCLDRGASESLKSTSTWIMGDRQVTESMGKIRCLLYCSLLTCNSVLLVNCSSC
jgi:hypothetical protein